VHGTPRGVRGLQEEEAVPHATRVQTDTVRYGAVVQLGRAWLPAGTHEPLVRGVHQPTPFVLALVIQRHLHLRALVGAMCHALVRLRTRSRHSAPPAFTLSLVLCQRPEATNA
jgi:hypothetical protein